ncbi:MAG: DUF4116 domain-containing protein, partial [Legionella sp.]|nr:DUF4116 domain-containing protein [Legionella sp.]
MKLNPNHAIYALPDTKPERSGDKITSEEFEALIASASELLDESLRQEFSKRMQFHAGADSTYGIKDDDDRGIRDSLEQALKVIYDRLTNPDTPESEKKIIAIKLQERAEACSPGFHIGVNSIVSGFFLAKSVKDLLFLMRGSLVEFMAQRLKNDVHVVNRASDRARELGFGLYTINKDDPHINEHIAEVPNEKIDAELKITFDKNMRLFSVLQGLEDQFKGQLSNVGYEGLKEDAYATDTLEGIETSFEMLYSNLPVASDLSKAKLAIAKQLKTTGEIQTDARKKMEEFLDAHPKEVKQTMDNLITDNPDKFRKYQENTLFKIRALLGEGGNIDVFRKFEKEFIKQVSASASDSDKAIFDAIKSNYKEKLSALPKDTRANLNAADKAFKTQFFLLNEYDGVTDINWPNVRQLLWESVKEQAYFELSETDKTQLDSIMDPNASHENRKSHIIGLLSNPENIQDAEQFLSYLNLSDAFFEEIAIALWKESESIDLAHELLFFAMTQKPNIYQSLSDTFSLPPKDFFIKILPRRGMLLQHASEELQADEEVVMTAVLQNGLALQYVSEDLKKDKVVVAVAVQQDGAALQYALGDLQDDEEIVLAAVQQNGLALEYASEDLRAKHKIALAAVQQDLRALKYTSKQFTLAVLVHNSVLQYASAELRGDAEVVAAALTRDVAELQYASDNLKDDRDFILFMVKRNSSVLQYASDRLRDDRDVVLAAMERGSDGFMHASAKLRGDKELAMVAVKKYGAYALQYASDDLRQDKEIVMAAVKQTVYAFESASDTLKADREIALVAMKKNGYVLKYASSA